MNKDIKRFFYFAYGMNTNQEEMNFRCRDSIYVGRAYVKNARLTFRRVADYENSEGYKLHGGLWLISEADLGQLDILEGYPSLYTRHPIKCRLYSYNHPQFKCFNNSEHWAIIYQMNSEDYREPSETYYDLVKQGYKEHRLPLGQLAKAKQDSIQKQKKFVDINNY
jgi:gamma-glutamylcyclotransferase (GGCT)/AIG2-like uncharacterized protein YtfP